MAWKEVDDLNAYVEKAMNHVRMKKKEPMEVPSKISNYVEIVVEDGRRCEKEVRRIEAETALHQEGGMFRDFQKPLNMPKDTVFMGEIRAKMQAKEKSLQVERRKTVSLREKIRQDGKALAERIKGKHDELAARFQKKGR